MFRRLTANKTTQNAASTTKSSVEDLFERGLHLAGLGHLRAA
jgi:hypothetical protein